jgi:hypothetical protein
MLDVKDIVTLDDGKNYAVVSKVVVDGVIYYYIMDIDDNTNFKYCSEKKTKDKLKLVLVTDKQLTKKLIRLFAINLRRELKEFEM